MHDSASHKPAKKVSTSYELAGYGLVLIATFSPCLLLPLGALILPQSSSDYFGAIIFSCVGLLLACSFFWFSYYVPYRLSGDVKARWGPVARNARQHMMTQIYRPFYAMQLPLFIHVLIYLMYLGFYYFRPQANSSSSIRMNNPGEIQAWLITGGMSLFGFIVFLPLGLKLRQVVNRRFFMNLRQRKICGDCNYDLRGNPDAPCPECGFDNRMLARQVAPVMVKRD